MSAAQVEPKEVIAKPCKDCIRGFTHEGTPTGQIIKLGNVDCYYAAPSTPGPHPTLIYITDVFGYSFINHQLLADFYAKENFHVYIPDLLAGDPFPASAMDFMDDESNSFCGSLWQTMQFMWLMPSFLSWLGRHNDAAALPILAPVVKEIKELAVKNGNGKLGAVGFCWGGRYAILLAGGDAPEVDAYAVAHPSNVVIPKDVEALKRPGLYCMSEKDFAISESGVEQIRSILEKKPEAKAEIVKYPGTQHGFAARGGPSTEEQRKQAAAKVVEFLREKLR
jgi:dienelactone hydrolase